MRRSGMRMRLREATGEDLELLDDLLLEAFDWDGTARFTREQVVTDTHTERYLGGWLRAGDFGLVAVDDKRPLGAVWASACRRPNPGTGMWPTTSPSSAWRHGFVVVGRNGGSDTMLRNLAGSSFGGGSSRGS